MWQAASLCSPVTTWQKQSWRQTHLVRRPRPLPAPLLPACSPPGFTQVPQKPACLGRDGTVQVRGAAMHPWHDRRMRIASSRTGGPTRSLSLATAGPWGPHLGPPARCRNAEHQHPPVPACCRPAPVRRRTWSVWTARPASRSQPSKWSRTSETAPPRSARQVRGRAVLLPLLCRAVPRGALPCSAGLHGRAMRAALAPGGLSCA